MAAKKTRLKLYCGRVTKYNGPDGKEIRAEAHLQAQYQDSSGEEIPENKVFFAATPSAHLTLTIDNPHRLDFFKERSWYYFDVTEATPAAEKSK